MRTNTHQSSRPSLIGKVSAAGGRIGLFFLLILFSACSDDPAGPRDPYKTDFNGTWVSYWEGDTATFVVRSYCSYNESDPDVLGKYTMRIWSAKDCLFLHDECFDVQNDAFNVYDRRSGPVHDNYYYFYFWHAVRESANRIVGQGLLYLGSDTVRCSTMVWERQ